MLVLLVQAAAAQLTIRQGGPDRVETVYKPVRRPVDGSSQGGVFSGIVPGAVIAAAAGGLLWWNEGRTVRRERLLDAARRKVIEHSSSREELDPAAPDQLLHLMGRLHSAEGVSDPLFPQVTGELGLERVSEVYQWLESERTEEVRAARHRKARRRHTTPAPSSHHRRHRHQVRVSSTHVRRETTYTYSREWRRDAIDSDRFRQSAAHRNPTPRLTPGVGTAFAPDATLEGWTLPPPLLQQLPWENLALGGGRHLPGGGGGEPVAAALRVEEALVAPVEDRRGGDALYLPLTPPEAQVKGGSKLELPGDVREWMEGEGAPGRQGVAVLRAPPSPQVGDAGPNPSPDLLAPTLTLTRTPILTLTRTPIPNLTPILILILKGGGREGALPRAAQPGRGRERPRGGGRRRAAPVGGRRGGGVRHACGRGCGVGGGSHPGLSSVAPAPWRGDRDPSPMARCLPPAAAGRPSSCCGRASTAPRSCCATPTARTAGPSGRCALVAAG